MPLRKWKKYIGKENLKMHPDNIVEMEEGQMAREAQGREYITKKEAKAIKELFKRNLKSYKEKDVSMSDEEWLERLFQTELAGIILEEEARQDAKEIASAISEYNENLTSVNEAAENGVSKERWLADKLSLGCSAVAANEYGQALQSIDDMLYRGNMEMAEALSRSSDGHIMMSPNLDGNIAEHMIAKTAEFSAGLQGKNIKVDVREAYTANSVDVRATNLDTGQYQNYQLKFGKDAKATIQLIENGNYNNQRIVVPTEQLDEVQEYFRAKGSKKTITDHIDAWGAESKKFTKAELKKIQEIAQKENAAPVMDYNQLPTKDLFTSIGKNAAVFGLQSAAITTGMNVAAKIFKGETVEPDELVETAIKTGVDTSVKTVAAGSLNVAVRKGAIGVLPKGTPASLIANIACVGVENVKILAKVASGELSVAKGIDHMGRATSSMVGGIAGAAKGLVVGKAAGALLAGIPVIGPPLAIATGVVGGMVGYFGGSKLGDAVYSAGKSVAKSAKNVAKTAWEGVKAMGKGLASVIRKPLRLLFG